MATFFPLTSGDSVKITDGTTQLKINADGSVLDHNRAPATATQVFKAINIVTATTNDIYTVTAGKTFYLTSVSICIGYSNASSQLTATAKILTDLNGSDEPIIGVVLRSRDGVGISSNISNSFPIPIVITAGKKLKSILDAAVTVSHFQITGYEV